MSPRTSRDETYTPDELQHAVVVPTDAEGQGDVVGAMLESTRRAEAGPVATPKRGRGPQKTPTKMAISIRVDREALSRYRATGRGWQTRLAADVERCAEQLTRKRRAG